MLVLHYTGMENCDVALNRLCDPNHEVSAHYLIDEDGTTYRLVPDEKRAWHAGNSYWRSETDVNSASLGIELVNPGHEFGYRPFPDAQISALIGLGSDLIAKYQIPAAGVVGHSDIAPGRKMDPGELFPWERLASSEIGLWSDATNELGDLHGSAWDQLASIGYAQPGNEAKGSSILNAESAETDVISAFQSRFTPNTVTGVLDNKTRKAIATITQLYA
jgi:N-acetylmuramoyl-L-alanine amidase